MRRFFRFASTLALVSVFATAAYADDNIGVDEVTLKNGGTIRGTVVSVEPGTKVVILELGQKQPRTLSWGEVADVQKGKFATSDEEKPEPGPSGPGYDKAAPEEEEAAAPSGPGVVKVHIESDEPVDLYEHIGTSVVAVGRYVAAIEHGRRVCGSPCDIVVDGSRGQNFVVMGDGIPNSRPFKLRDRTNDTTLVVDGGSSGGIYGGVMMISFGGAALLSGVLTMALGGALATTSSDAEPYFYAGGGLLGGGAGLLGGGIALVVVSRTKLEIQDGAEPVKKDNDEAFMLDSRPREVAPRYWLGEF